MKSVHIRGPLIFTIFILLYGLMLYYFLKHYVNFPESILGYDSIPHVAKISMLSKWGLEGFRWLPNYYFGNPHFTFYTPSTYIIPLLFQYLFNLSEEGIVKLFNWAGYFSIISSLSFIMLLSYLKSGYRLSSALLSGIFFGASPGIFEPWLFGGNSAELFSLPSIPLGLILLDRFLKTGKLNYLLFFLIVGVYAITGHQAVGMFYLVFSFSWILGNNITREQKIVKIITLSLTLLCSAAWYIIPLAYMELTHKIRGSLWMKIPSELELGDYIVTFLNIEIHSLPSRGYRFPGFLLTVLLPVILYIINRLHKNNCKKKSSNEAITTFSIGIGILLYFILWCVGFLLSFPEGFHPSRFIPYIVISFSISIGLLINHAPSFLLKALPFIFISTGLMFSFLFPPSYNVAVSNFLSVEDKESLQKIKSLAMDHDVYRIGGVRDDLFYWVYLYYPHLYTSRGYYAQGILYIDWQAWFEHALAGAPPTLQWNNSILHLLDWTGTRYVGLMKNDTAAILLSNSVLKPLTTFLNFTIYEFPYSPPISETVYDGGILVFSDSEGYDVILRSIAISNYVKPAPIIVWAEDKCIDDVSLNVLEKFSSIILYRYCYRDKEKAFNLLADYVSRGGRLFIETMSSVDESSGMPQPIPISKTYREAVQESWNFSISEDLLTANITGEIFSPPIYDNGPWGVSSSTMNDLRSEAKPLLTSRDKILVAYIRYGNGIVVWSGMNLPYHVLSYQNIAEADFMKKLIMYDIIVRTEPAEMIRNSATSIIFKAQPSAKGIIFRERYISNLIFSWRATDLYKELDVFMMGPGFNYIVLNGRYGGENIRMSLHDGPLRICSIMLSVLAALLCIAVLLYTRYKAEKKPRKFLIKDNR